MSILYNNFLNEYLDGNVNFSTDKFKIALLTSTYTPSAEDTAFASLEGYETSGEGYTAGGSSITFTSSVLEGTTDLVGSRTMWTGSTFTARYAVIYREEVDSDGGLLVSCHDFGSDQTVTSGTFVITWDNVSTISITINSGV